MSDREQDELGARAEKTAELSETAAAETTTAEPTAAETAAAETTAELSGDGPTERRPPVEATAPRPATLGRTDEPRLRDVGGTLAAYLRGRAALLADLVRRHRGAAARARSRSSRARPPSFSASRSPAPSRSPTRRRSSTAPARF